VVVVVVVVLMGRVTAAQEATAVPARNGLSEACFMGPVVAVVGRDSKAVVRRQWPAMVGSMVVAEVAEAMELPRCSVRVLRESS
jgi:hypothetical protein